VSRIFRNRAEAGRALAQRLLKHAPKRPIVLGLPRGGLPVAFEVAKALDAPLDALVVRKLGAPFQPELAIGAIASGGIRVLNDELVGTVTGIDEGVLDEIIARETAELQRRERILRDDRPFPDLSGRDVILVDDGLATGATMCAAIEAVRSMAPASVIVAIPTASASAVRRIESLADDVICLQSPPGFYAVGQSYADFAQTSDEEVRSLLQRAGERAVDE
jgi:putative phosphoribosyl transferase